MHRLAGSGISLVPPNIRNYNPNGKGAVLKTASRLQGCPGSSPGSSARNRLSGGKVMFFAPSSEGVRIESFEFVASGSEEMFGDTPEEAVFPFWDFTAVQITIWADSAVSTTGNIVCKANVGEEVVLAEMVSAATIPAGQKISLLCPVGYLEIRPGANTTVTQFLLDSYKVQNRDEYPYPIMMSHYFGSNEARYQMYIEWPGSSGIMKHVKYKFLKFV